MKQHWEINQQKTKNDSSSTFQCFDGDYQQEPSVQCTLADRYLLCYFRSLYIIECTVSRYRKCHCLCRCDNGIVPFCNNADELE